MCQHLQRIISPYRQLSLYFTCYFAKFRKK